MKKDILQEQVMQVLKDIPITRNDDDELVWEVWTRFYNNHPKYIYKEQYKTLPKVSSIERYRRKIQNYMKLYLPTDWKIAEMRGFAEQEWKERLGYWTPDKNQLTLNMGV